MREGTVVEDSLLIRVEEPDAGEERLAELALALREELLVLDVEDVSSVRRGPAPAGTRGLDVATVGELLVSVKLTGEILRAVVTTVRGWLARGGGGGRGVTLTIGDRTLQLNSASPEQQERLIEAFLSVPPRE